MPVAQVEGGNDLGRPRRLQLGHIIRFHRLPMQQYHLRVISMATGMLTWLKFTYVSEN